MKCIEAAYDVHVYLNALASFRYVDFYGWSDTLDHLLMGDDLLKIYVFVWRSKDKLIVTVPFIWSEMYLVNIMWRVL